MKMFSQHNWLNSLEYLHENILNGGIQMSKKQSNNPYQNEVLKKRKPMKKEGEEVREGEPFLEEELEQEIEDIKEIENEINTDELEEQSVAELSDEVIELKDALKESHNKLLLSHAELENIRRRAKQDVEKAHKYGLDNFVKGLLPVIDSLEHALENAKKAKSEKAMVEGVELTLKNFLDVLEKFGVKQIYPLGKPFDPQFHEAMTMVEDPKAKPNTVVEVFQRGYELNGRLVRPARVVVSKKKN